MVRIMLAAGTLWACSMLHDVVTMLILLVCAAIVVLGAAYVTTTTEWKEETK